MKYLFACYTDKGKRKGVNQDSLLISYGNWRGQKVVLAVICDGIGGLKRGEQASGEVVWMFARWFREDFPTLAGREEFEDELYESWEALFQIVNRKIMERGENVGIKSGTTATAMLLWQERFFIAHVGDCRIYEIKEQVRQLTKDQVQGTHILMQGIGVSKVVRPVYYSGEVKEDAVYLLCTDGFRHKIRVEELGQAFAPLELSGEEIMRHRGERVARTAMERGEEDNMSVIFVRTIPGQERKAGLDGGIPEEYVIEEIIRSDGL